MTDHRSAFLVAGALAIVAGALTAVQGTVNGKLADAGPGAVVASWISFAVSLTSVIVVLGLLGRWRSTWRILRERGSWWWFAIGLCGMPIVLAMASGAPIIGIAFASVCSIGGQTVSGLVLDARGIGVSAPIALTARRIWSALCALAGLLFTALAGGGPDAGSWTRGVAAAAFLFVAGLVLTGQNSGNGAVTARSGDPIIALLTSVSGGMVAMTAVLLIDLALGDQVRLPTAPSDWWLYSGGLLGAVLTVMLAWAVRHLGALVMTLAVVGGQMVTALGIDLLTGVGANWGTAVAIGAIAASVLLSSSSAMSSSRGPHSDRHRE